MTRTLAAVAAVLLSLATPASAHRLDEYLEAALVSIEKGQVQVSLRLIPGAAVSSAVISSIDINEDSLLSKSEQQNYASTVLRDLSLSIDGHPLQPHLVSVAFPTIEEMKEGLGEIKIEFTADLPRGGTSRNLILENRHQSRISAYLVNCLVPRDKNIRVVAQNRNELQSFYQLEYAQTGDRSEAPASFGALLFWYRGFASMFRLGIRHIAEGTDHLLFLLALLLPRRSLASVHTGEGSLVYAPVC